MARVRQDEAVVSGSGAPREDDAEIIRGDQRLALAATGHSGWIRRGNVFYAALRLPESMTRAWPMSGYARDGDRELAILPRIGVSMILHEEALYTADE